MKEGLGEIALIGIGTRNRNQMLKNALDSVGNLNIPRGLAVRVVVMDNSTEENARAIVEEMMAVFPFDLEYKVQWESGIVPVRNAILNYAMELGSDYLIFFDDDMTVSPGWVKELYLTQKANEADAVCGRVKYVLPVNAERWLHNLDFYGSYSRPTGSLIQSGRTNNVLINMAFLTKHSLSFEKRLNESGGSDTYFFQKLIKLGGRIVWSDEALLFEEVPFSRANANWILQRAFKVAYTRYIRSRIDYGKLHAKLEALTYGSGQLLQFVGMLPFFLVLPKHKRVYWTRKWAKFRGSMAGVFGMSHREYEIIHGY